MCSEVEEAAGRHLTGPGNQGGSYSNNTKFARSLRVGPHANSEDILTRISIPLVQLRPAWPGHLVERHMRSVTRARYVASKN